MSDTWRHSKNLGANRATPDQDRRLREQRRVAARIRRAERAEQRRRRKKEARDDA